MRFEGQRGGTRLIFFFKKTRLLRCNSQTKASPRFDAQVSGVNSTDDVVRSSPLSVVITSTEALLSDIPIAPDPGHRPSGSVSVSLPVLHVSRALSVLCLASSFSITFSSPSLQSRESALHSSRLSTIPRSGWTVFYWSLVCWWTHGSALQLPWKCGGGPLCPRFRFLWVCTQERNRWPIWKPGTELEDLRGGCSSLHLLVFRLPLLAHGLFLPSTLPRGRSWGDGIQGPLDAPASQRAQLLGDGEKRREGRRWAMGHPHPCGRLGGPRLLSSRLLHLGSVRCFPSPRGLSRQPPGPVLSVGRPLQSLL